VVFPNGIIKASVDLRLHNEVDIRVLHIPGEDNQIADALSRMDFDRALSLRPSLMISSFTPFCPDADDEPPQPKLGGGQK
jgi:hypothetical protein